MKVIKESIPFIITIICIILIRAFITTPVRVDGISMDNTLKDGEILLLNKLDNNYERFEVVVFTIQGERLIKRVIGLPGEKVEFKDNSLYINDALIEDNYGTGITSDFNIGELDIDKIKEDEYLLIGDNRNDSLDSRYFGTIKKKDIIGTVKYRLFPFNKLGNIDK